MGKAPPQHRTPAPGRTRSRLRRAARAVWVSLGDLTKIALSEIGQLVIQVAIPALLLWWLSQAGAAEDRKGRVLHFNPMNMSGPALPTEAVARAAPHPEAPAPSVSPLSTPVWANRAAYILPCLRDTSILLLAGLAAASVLAMLLVLPALRTQNPAVRWLFKIFDEFGLFLCSVPVFVAGFVLRIKVPPDERVLYYCVAALTLGVANLTLAEMVQMLRIRLSDEISQPYFDLVEVRGFTFWRRLVHRWKPYARALLLSLRSKVPILFSSVVIIEIILSLDLPGGSPIKKGLGWVAKQAAAQGDGITLLAVILVVALWIRAFSFFANTVTYFFLWNPRSAE